MGRSRISKTVKGQSTAVSSSRVTSLIGPPMLAYGSDVLRALVNVKQLTGSWTGQVRYRTFQASLSEPSAWTPGATNLNAAGEWAEDFVLSGSYLWIQTGLAAGATSGVAEAHAELTSLVKGDGALLASQTFEIEPDTNSGQASYLLLTKAPVPVLGLAGLMFGAIVTGVNGTLQWNVAWRQVKANAENPTAWVDLIGTSAFATANGQWNSGDLPVSPGANGWVELALKVPANSARGRIQVFAAGRY